MSAMIVVVWKQKTDQAGRQLKVAEAEHPPCGSLLHEYPALETCFLCVTMDVTWQLSLRLTAVGVAGLVFLDWDGKLLTTTASNINEQPVHPHPKHRSV